MRFRGISSTDPPRHCQARACRVPAVIFSPSVSSLDVRCVVRIARSSDVLPGVSCADSPQLSACLRRALALRTCGDTTLTSIRRDPHDVGSLHLTGPRTSKSLTLDKCQCYIPRRDDPRPVHISITQRRHGAGAPCRARAGCAIRFRRGILRRRSSPACVGLFFDGTAPRHRMSRRSKAAPSLFTLTMPSMVRPHTGGAVDIPVE